MYAALVIVAIDPAQTETADAFLKDAVVPLVQGSPGFVAGYWMQPVDGKAA